MAKLREIRSREYKVMLDHRALRDRPKARDELRSELGALATTMKSVAIDGRFDEEKTRTIVFLDTPDRTLLGNGLVLRRRSDPDGDHPEYTLKCRSDDRLLAAGAALDPGDGFTAKRKLEEDIAPPFRCRFSQSSSIEPPADDDSRSKAPKRLVEAARLYPVLGTLRYDGRRCYEDTPLEPVNALAAFERVRTGATLSFTGEHDACDASIALIEWSSGEEGRPVCAELSFRIKAGDGADELMPDPTIATAVRDFFEQVQQLDGSRPDGMTKTEFAYRTRRGV